MKSRKKTVTKAKKTPRKSTRKSSQKIKKVSTKKMDDFQQYVVLAAVINQLRDVDADFRSIPLPDVNSSLLAPLRKQFKKYAFTAKDIKTAVSALIKSKVFKEHFPVTHAMKVTFKLTEKNNPTLMADLLELAGLEARRPIYLAEQNPHDIQKTTLEKHALKAGFIKTHHAANESPMQKEDPFANKRILIKLNYNTLGRNMPSNLQILSAKHRRGRG